VSGAGIRLLRFDDERRFFSGCREFLVGKLEVCGLPLDDAATRSSLRGVPTDPVADLKFCHVDTLAPTFAAENGNTGVLLALPARVAVCRRKQVDVTKPPLRPAIIGLAISVAVLLGQIGLFLWALADRQANDEMSLANFFAFVQIALVAAVIPFIGWFVLMLVVAARDSALLAAFPSAYVSSLVVTGPLVVQLDAIAAATGKPRPKIWIATYATFVADTDSLRIYNGLGKPIEQLSIPLAALTGANAGSFGNGFRTVTAFALTVTPQNGIPFALTIVPVRFRGPFVGAVRPAELPVELKRMQAATHPATV
jgi:hypothetical protein